jgi:hypothetical protein
LPVDRAAAYKPVAVNAESCGIHGNRRIALFLDDGSVKVVGTGPSFRSSPSPLAADWAAAKRAQYSAMEAHCGEVCATSPPRWSEQNDAEMHCFMYRV